jgi:hypothetical protein
MNDRLAAARALFDDLAVDHLGRPHVTMGRMFASEGLAVHGKIFAFVGRDGRLILKLPLVRAEELKGKGATEPVTLGGRTMREWVGVQLPDRGPGSWAGLMEEAHAYVADLAGAASDQSPESR